MRVTVDRDRCIGAGNCALIAPSVFDQEPEDAVVVLLDDAPPEDSRPADVDIKCVRSTCDPFCDVPADDVAGDSGRWSHPSARSHFWSGPGARAGGGRARGRTAAPAIGLMP